MRTIPFSKIFWFFTFMLGFQSCDTKSSSVATDTRLNTVKQILTSGTDQGFSVLGNVDSFLTNTLIDAVIPEELKKINTQLENLGLESLVEKEKQYIGKAAAASVNTVKPIITSAIQELTLSDAISILSGGKGAATQYLKNKTRDKLIEAIQPQVETLLNSGEVLPLINKATKDKTIQSAINIITGNKETTNIEAGSSISRYATEQIVDGLFEVTKDYEVNNFGLTESILKSTLNK
ncbi:MAG: DUF4197 domain-containing protein [Flavobacteriaceae bacterium]|nr:DUF4197 domain-containing protein [Flavobacteriaceae bacterium]